MYFFLLLALMIILHLIILSYFLTFWLKKKIHWTERGIIQFSSVTQLCLTLCDPMDCSMPGFPVLHYLLELAQTQVHWVGGAIQPSHPLLSPSPPASNVSQHQGLFLWVSSSYQVAKVLELQLQSFQWIFRLISFRMDLQLKGLSRVFSNTTVQKHQFFALSFLRSPTLTSIHDHRKNHSLD